MNPLVLVYMFVMGLCVGSFLNVLIWRTLHKMSPYSGRSICDHCKRKLTWWENIPVLSYVALGGKCRTCKIKIDPSYPLVELVTGLLFLWWGSIGFAFFQLSQAPLSVLQPGFWLLVGVVLIVIFFADVLYGIIPDFAVVLLGLTSLAYRVVLMALGSFQTDDLVKSLVVGLGVGLFYLLLFVGTKARGIGFGDVKLSFVLGFLLGFPAALVATYLAFVSGGLVAGGMLLLGKKKFGQTLPFGPFMVAATVVALVWGEQLWFWYLKFLGW